LVSLRDLRAANGAVKLVRVVHTKRLGLFRQPRTGSTLPVDGWTVSPVNIFLEKFGDGKPPEVLVMDLSNLKMNAKEKVKDFNQRFLTLKNRIPTDSMPAESLVIAYYTKALHQSIAIWVKRSKKATLLEAFEEATQIEKDILSLKDSSSNETENTASSKKKIEILPRPTQNKAQPENSELENLTKIVQKLSNQVVDIKRSTEEASSSKGPYRPPFRKPFQTNRPNPNPEGMNLESLQYALQSILGAQDDLIPPDFPQEEVEQETTQEEEPSSNVFGHLSDSIFQANFETVHPYNTRSKAANKPPADNTTTLSSMLSKSVETKQTDAGPKLDYDVVEDLKKLRANISIYELLKFPFLLQKMLQNISDNSKNGNSNSSKVGQSNVITQTCTYRDKVRKLKCDLKCNQEGGHCHLTNPLSLQANSSLAQGGFPGLRLLGLGEMKLKVM
jgi:hypothetical protein